MAFIKEHDLLPVLHPPVQVSTCDGKSLVLHGLGEQGSWLHLPGGQIEVLVAKPLDSPDRDGL
jgi:hypothetical protein